MDPVPRIQKTINDINSSRWMNIRDLLASVAKRGNNIVVNQKSIGGYSYVLGVSDTNETGNNYLDWRFRTGKNDFFGMYYEKWCPYESDMYFLDRVYFHLFKYDKNENIDKEYILLHCDTSEPENTPHSIYKQSPHIHVCCAEQPIPHSHLALNNNNLFEIYQSLDDLNMAIKQAIDMINDQVLNRI